MLDQAQMTRKNTHACTQVALILKRTFKDKEHKSDSDARPWILFTFFVLKILFYWLQFSLICMDVVSVYFAFRLLSPWVTSRMCSRTHGRGCVAFWQRGWNRCQGCECERRSWRRSERSGWWLLVLWRSSSLCSAGAEGAGGPACWGTFLPSEPSHQTSGGEIQHFSHITWENVLSTYKVLST